MPEKGGVNRLGVTVKTHEAICKKVESLLTEDRREHYL
jgi:hypothetical protein